MSSNINVLQVIPKLGYGGAETGCYDIAHYLPENNCKSFIVTSGGELTKFIDKKKVKLIFFFACMSFALRIIWVAKVVFFRPFYCNYYLQQYWPPLILSISSLV